MRTYSTELVTIDGKTRTRYQWSQEMRRVETAIRQQKDTATLARASGDDKLRKRCQGMILQLNKKYAALAQQAGLKPEFQRTYVAGFKDISLSNKRKSGTIQVAGQSFSAAAYVGQAYLHGAGIYIDTSRVCIRYSKKGWHALR